MASPSRYRVVTRTDPSYAYETVEADRWRLLPDGALVFYDGEDLAKAYNARGGWRSFEPVY